MSSFWDPSGWHVVCGSAGCRVLVCSFLMYLEARQALNLVGGEDQLPEVVEALEPLDASDFIPAQVELLEVDAVCQVLDLSNVCAAENWNTRSHQGSRMHMG